MIDKPSRLHNIIITIPFQMRKGSYVTLTANLVNVLLPSSERITLITANFPANNILSEKVDIINIKFTNVSNNIISRLYSALKNQCIIIYYLIKLNNNINGNIFILSGTYLLPTLAGRLMCKPVILTAIASESRNAANINKNGFLKFRVRIYPKMVSFFERLTFLLSAKIMVESPHVTSFIGLEKYGNKIIPNGGLFVDINKFNIKKAMSLRENVIGFIGRLSDEKGIDQFIKSVPMITRYRKDIRFVIIGNGPLYRKIISFIHENDLINYVKMVDWIDHDALPEYLNDIKLIVVPSSTEGLPNVVLEAMACGTIVLGTPVGGIPDVISNEKSGFLMDNNFPEEISSKIISIIDRNDLDNIAMTGRSCIENNYSYDGAVKRYEQILKSIKK